jgi:hypothetical protein
LLLTMAGAAAQADDAPVAAVGVFDVAAFWEARDWRLDAAVFTEISAVNASDVAIKLPADQAPEDESR